MESRRLLAVTADLVDGTLQIALDGAGDEATLVPSGLVYVVSGTGLSPTLFENANVEAIEVVGSGAAGQSFAVGPGEAVTDRLLIADSVARARIDSPIAVPSGNIQIDSSELTLGADITTRGDLFFAGDVLLTDSATLAAGSGNVTFAGAIEGVESGWATRAGGSGGDEAFSISTLADGSSIVTGSFSGVADFGHIQLTSAGTNDIFIARMNADGNFTWATQAGGRSGGSWSDTVIESVSTFADGSSIVMGTFSSSVATFGTTELTRAGGQDVFIAKLNADGNWAWATRAGGREWDYGYSISTLADSSSIVTGAFSGTADFGGIELTSAGSSDAFIAKLNADGSYAWATRAGGVSGDRGESISTLADGSSIVTGYFHGTADFGGIQLTSAGSSDAFIAKLNADGSWAWVTQARSVDGISAFADGSSIVTGTFSGTATFGTTQLTSADHDDVFIAKLNADGSWAWVTQVGGRSRGGVRGISTLADGSSIFAGFFYSGTADFGVTQLTSAGYNDVFIAKLNANGSLAWVTQAGGSLEDRARSISTLADGSSIVTGYFDGTADFGGTQLTSAGSGDIFIIKLDADGSWTTVAPEPAPLPSLTIIADGTTTFFGTVGGLKDLITDPGGTTRVAASIFTAGEQFFGDDVILAASAVLDAGAGNVTFAGLLEGSRPPPPSAYPSLIGEAVPLAGGASRTKLSADGRYGYVATSGSGLQIVDLKNATNPTVVGGWDTTHSARDVALSPDGRLAYVAAGFSGVQIIDVQDPTAPVRVGSFETGLAQGVAISMNGRHLYVADILGLRILDVENAATPTETGAITGIGYARSVLGYMPVHETGNAVKVTLSPDERYAYVADRNFGLQIFDVRDPTAPRRAGGFDATEFIRANDVTLSENGRYAYVVDSDVGLLIVDAQDPANLSILGGFKTPDYAQGVTLSPDERHAYVADGFSGLQIINVENPAETTHVASIDTNRAHGVAVSADGRHAYLADLDGLLIIDLINPLPALTIFASGTTRLNRSVTDLASLTVSGGTTHIGGDITTARGQSFGGEVVLQSDAMLTGDSLHFSGGVDGGESRLVLNANLNSGTDPTAFTNITDLTLIKPRRDNAAATAVTTTPTSATLPENTDTTHVIKVADIRIEDDDLGGNEVSLSGPEAEFFTVEPGADRLSFMLFLKAGTNLDFETKENYAVSVRVRDFGVSGPPSISTDFTLSITDMPEIVRPVLDPEASPTLGVVHTDRSFSIASLLVGTDAPGLAVTGLNLPSELLARVFVQVFVEGEWISQELVAPTAGDWTTVTATSAIVLHTEGNARLSILTQHNQGLPALADIITFKAWSGEGGFAHATSGVETTESAAFSIATDTVNSLAANVDARGSDGVGTDAAGGYWVNQLPLSATVMLDGQPHTRQARADVFASWGVSLIGAENLSDAEPRNSLFLRHAETGTVYLLDCSDTWSIDLSAGIFPLLRNARSVPLPVSARGIASPGGSDPSDSVGGVPIRLDEGVLLSRDVVGRLFAGDGALSRATEAGTASLRLSDLPGQRIRHVEIVDQNGSETLWLVLEDAAGRETLLVLLQDQTSGDWLLPANAPMQILLEGADAATTAYLLPLDSAVNIATGGVSASTARLEINGVVMEIPGVEREGQAFFRFEPTLSDLTVGDTAVVRIIDGTDATMFTTQRVLIAIGRSLPAVPAEITLGGASALPQAFFVQRDQRVNLMGVSIESGLMMSVSTGSRSVSVVPPYDETSNLVWFSLAQLASDFGFVFSTEEIIEVEFLDGAGKPRSSRVILHVRS